MHDGMHVDFYYPGIKPSLADAATGQQLLAG
jgi:hypothetical protein